MLVSNEFKTCDKRQQLAFAIRPKVVIPLLVVMVLNVLGCDRSGIQETEIQGDKTPLRVNALRLTLTQQPVETVTYFGKLAPTRSATVVFPVAGTLASMSQVGAKLNQGQIVARLDTTAQEQEKDRLKASLNQDTEPALRANTETRIRELERRIKQGRYEAPFDCVVADIFQQALTPIGPGKPVATLHSTENPTIEINLPTRIATLISEQQEFVFVIGTTSVKGKLARKSPQESALGTITVWFSVQDTIKDSDHPFGKSVEARFNLPRSEAGFWIPMEALQRDGRGIWSLLVVPLKEESESGICERRMVSVDLIADKFVLINGDIKDGELIVANGTHRVVPGQEVLVRLDQNEPTKPAIGSEPQ